MQRGCAINRRCAAVKGAILGSQGVSFVLQVRRLPSKGGAFCGWWGETRPDQTRQSPPSSPPFSSWDHQPQPLSLQVFHWHRALELCGKGGETGEEGASLLPAQSVWGNCFLCCVLDETLTFAGRGEVPRPQALVAFCIHFSGFQTGSNLGAEVRKQSIRLILTAQLWPSERQGSWFLLPRGLCGRGLT